MMLTYTVFLTPLVVTCMFIHEMSGSLFIQATGMHQIIWETLRTGLIVVLLTIRLKTYRDEL